LFDDQPAIERQKTNFTPRVTIITQSTVPSFGQSLVFCKKAGD